ncbi:MAG: hypothetical protein LBF65_00100 [Holosporales bacterium]|jgi:hypothetical protein|nr:hypothetical protein [Holosporales bacterium]
MKSKIAVMMTACAIAVVPKVFGAETVWDGHEHISITFGAHTLESSTPNNPYFVQLNGGIIVAVHKRYLPISGENIFHVRCLEGFPYPPNFKDTVLGQVSAALNVVGSYLYYIDSSQVISGGAVNQDRLDDAQRLYGQNNEGNPAELQAEVEQQGK